MEYIKYIKLNGEQEYRISNDGTELQSRHIPSQGTETWHTENSSSSNKFLSLRASHTGNSIECLKEDGKWYHFGLHGGLTLTADELNKMHQEKKRKKEASSPNEEKKSKSGVAAFIGGAGAAIGSTRKALRDFQAIEDTSGIEKALDDFTQGWLERARVENEERNRRDAEYKKKEERWSKKRKKELEILKEKEQRYAAKENKKRIYSNLNNLVKVCIDENTPLMLFDERLICKFIGIFDEELMAAVERAVIGFEKSYRTVGKSEKFFRCWIEIFYLIEEGLLFNDTHIKQITTIINNACGQEGKEPDDKALNDFLDMCYSKLEYSYRGDNFEKDPEEDEVKKRIRYLESHFMYYEGIEDEMYHEEDNGKGYNKEDDDDEDDDDEDDENGDDDEDEDDDEGENDDEDDEDDDEDDEDDDEDEDESDDEDEDDDNDDKCPSANKCQGRKATVAQRGRVNDEKYEDLQSVGFEKEDSSDDMLKPKNAFDLITKGKNKQISYYKKKWNDSMWKLDHELKERVLREIVRIEEDAMDYVSSDDLLNELLRSGKSEGFLGFGGNREVKDVKSKMNDLKERIKEQISKLSEVMSKVKECEDNIKEYSEELYDLTGKEKYDIIKPLDGLGINIARKLIKCKINPMSLKSIFDL
jgi:hypothetical protein